MLDDDGESASAVSGVDDGGNILASVISLLAQRCARRAPWEGGVTWEGQTHNLSAHLECVGGEVATRRRDARDKGSATAH